ncbi:ABC transporter permease [Agromyces sp. SYSU T00194]|uniref:ABC transporter permease n=1 Tax=Agromyces chitinivorans TaxID=3158560 RepID=UPI003395D53E
MIGIALHAEVRKALASRVLRWTTLLVVAGLALIVGGMTLAVRAGDPQVVAKLGQVAGLEGWAAVTAMAAQVTSAGALVAMGVALSWVFGREFADGTVPGLFALPVPRAAIALAKLLVHLAWVAATSVLLVAAVWAVGALTGAGALDGASAAALGRQLLLGVLTGCIATPAAWAATLGRGLLPGIATTIGIVVVSQVMAVAGVGGWFPFTAPALWAIEPGTVGGAQLALVAVVPLGFGALTALAWHRLQLDR